MTLDACEFLHYLEEIVRDNATHLLKKRSEVFVVRFDERMDFMAAFLEQVVEDVGFLFSRSNADEKCKRQQKSRVDFVLAHPFRLESAVSQALHKQAILVSECFFIHRSIKGFPKSVYGELVVIRFEDR